VEQPGKSDEDKKQLLLDFAHSLLPEGSAPAVSEANLQGIRALRQRVAANVATDLQVKFIGQQIEGLKDLVEKAQTLTNPGFETCPTPSQFLLQGWSSFEGANHRMRVKVNGTKRGALRPRRHPKPEDVCNTKPGVPRSRSAG
jgi:hypothetical protein